MKLNLNSRLRNSGLAKFVLAASLLLSLCACSQFTPLAATQTPQGVSPTPHPATASPVPSGTPTPLPSPTSGPTATVSPTPVTASTPDPLHGAGPWIAISASSTKNEEGIPDEIWMVGEKDGSAWHTIPVPFPTLPPQRPWRDRIWKLAPAKGGVAALYTILYEDPYPFPQTIEDPANQIWVVHFPENKLIRALPLLGPAALAQTKIDIKEIHYKELNRTLPTTLGTIGYPHWSPDGRYLAYSAALTGTKADIYIYDRLMDQTHQLTYGQDNAFVSAWTPDGEHILFYEVSFQGFLSLSGISFSTMKVVSMTGQVMEILRASDQGFIEHAAWLDSHRLLLFDQLDGFGGVNDMSDLRIFDIQLGAVRTLFAGFFFNFAVDPISSTVLVSTDSFIPPKNPLPGAYRVNLETGGLTPLLMGEFINLHWYAEQGLFSAELTGEKDTKTVVFFSPSGKEKVRFTQVDGEIIPSPDGSLFLVNQQSAMRLYDARGNLIKEVLPSVAYDHSGQPYTWLADSSGFYQRDTIVDDPLHNIYYFSSASHWSPVLVHTGTGEMISILP